jgi:4-hydroxythreonine-4-phosphate dehydrogenase
MASSAHHRRPFLAFTQGDPAGVGPELLLELAASVPPGESGWRPLWVAESAALEAAAPAGHELAVRVFDRLPGREELEALAADEIPLVDPVGDRRRITLGRSGPADAAGALAAIDTALELARSGAVDGMVTAPVAKDSIARHCDPAFRGHTDYLAQACGLEEYGRDYLMAFLTSDLQVALLSTHVPLCEAIGRVTRGRIEAALSLLGSAAGGRVAVAGLNPHAGEGGLMGSEDEREIRPAVEAARARGVDAHGPESPDSLFSRARRGEFDWVLALYHDQGLIAVKTAAFGESVNWTLGLPVLRVSVDHGTAFAIAGRGLADARPLRAAAEGAIRLLRGELPRRGAARP